MIYWSGLNWNFSTLSVLFTMEVCDVRVCDGQFNGLFGLKIRSHFKVLLLNYLLYILMKSTLVK